MTKRLPTSSKQNNWFDSQQVDDNDLKLEQDHNEQVTSAIVNNHFGSGILLSNTTENILFNSDDVSGYLDGVGLYPTSQPSDTNLGNFLSLSLSGSNVFGNRKIKVCLIGLDFNSNLQYETFYFSRNETQTTSKHYTKLLLILINDMKGNVSQSFNLGGTLSIFETKSLTISRDPIMISQNIEPNLFFRDFYIDGPGTLSDLLTTSLPDYNINNLNINTSYLKLRSLDADDVSTQIGQKFLATTNNIQKIRLLLAVEESTLGSGLVWTGDIVVSIYQLQSNVSCPTDISPGLEIDFDPNNIPLAQLSFNYNTLSDKGYILDSVPQPIDFVFSNTNVANSTINVGKYYIVTVKRSGSADNANILFAVGSNKIEDTKLCIFDGNSWTNISDEDLWFEIYTDSIKVSDGSAYESGHGIQLPKIETDTQTSLNIDYLYNKINFSRNYVYSAWLQAITKTSDNVQDQRTGEDVASRKQYYPAITLLTATELNSLDYSEPLLIGNVSDKNTKGFSASDSQLNIDINYFNFIGNKIIIKVITDNTDGYYRASINNLKTAVLNGSVLGSKIVPNRIDSNLYYKVAKAQICERVYGDINGDSIVDDTDLSEVQKLVGYDLTNIPDLNTYITLTNKFINDSAVVFNTSGGSLPDVSATDGVLSVNVLDDTLANFYSPTVDFTTLVNPTSKDFTISTSLYTENVGTFSIYSVVDANNIIIKKKYIDKEKYLKILSADITGNFQITSQDVTYIDNYVNKVLPIPNNTSPANKIGTVFEVIILELESFIDRKDDYTTNVLLRDSLIHPIKDILTLDSYFASGYVFGSDIQMQITKQLNWEDYLIVTNSKTKYLPCSFTYTSGDVDKVCEMNDVNCTDYPDNLTFDPGKNNLYAPNDLIIDKGDIINLDGTKFKIDFEVGTFTLEMPAIDFTEEKSLNIFTDLVAEYSNGKTRLGYEPLRFADCTKVGLDALGKEQVRFNVSVQSFSANLDGYDIDGYTGTIVDNKIGVFIDYSTGILKLFFTNLENSNILDTMKTRVQIVVYLKKSGFNNQHKNISYDKIKNLFSL